MRGKVKQMSALHRVLSEHVAALFGVCQNVIASKSGVFGNARNLGFSYLIRCELSAELLFNGVFANLFAADALGFYGVESVRKRSVVNHLRIFYSRFFKFVELRYYNVVGVIFGEILKIVIFADICRKRRERAL